MARRQQQPSRNSNPSPNNRKRITSPLSSYAVPYPDGQAWIQNQSMQLAERCQSSRNLPVAALQGEFKLLKKAL
jgi:hypothetical protein